MYEIKTTDMRRARDVSNAVIDGVMDNTLDVRKANTVNNAVGGLIRAVTTDIKARLANSKMLESEAKLVEAQKRPEPDNKIEAKAA